MLNLNPLIVSLSEFFSVLGGPAALAGGILTGTEVWKRMSALRPELKYALEYLDIPELRGADKSAEHPLMLVTLPSISDHPELLLSDMGKELVTWPRMELSELYSRTFMWLSGQAGATLWVERSGGSLSYAHNLLAMWPHARFIHIARDGRECAISMSRHDGFRLWVSTAVEGTPSLYSRGLDIDIEKFGYLWTSMILRRGRLLERLPRQQFLLLKYEDLVTDPERELVRVCKFLRVDRGNRQWIQRAAVLAQPTATRFWELDSAQQKALQRVCLPGLKMLGYD